MQRSRSRTRKQSMRGGDASNWVTSNFGNGNDQWNNTFSGRSGVGSLSNLLPTVPGAPAVLSGNIPQGTLSLKNIPFMSGGRRRRRRHRGGGVEVMPPLGQDQMQAGGRRSRRKRSQKGGFWGQMLAQAAVPLTLLGLQQSFKRKRHR